jgi:hypothetical protein
VVFCALVLLGVHRPHIARSDEPRSTTRPSELPIPVFVETPADLEALIKRLRQPDFVIESGAAFAQRQAAATAAPGGGASPSVVVESIAIEGDVFDEIAHLTINVVAIVKTPDPVKVPLALDSLGIVEAREGEKQLFVAAANDGGWQVELRGAGRHAVRLRALARVKPGADGPRLEFGIPQVASTSIELNVGPGVKTAFTGGREPISAEPIEGDQRTRLSAHLSPRKRIDVTWLVQSDARAQAPLHLAAQGEIALTVDPAWLRSQSSWLLRCEQGTTRAIAARIDPAEELLGIEINDRPLAADGGRDPNTGVLTIPLAEPLRPGKSLRLALTTRRPLPSATRSARLVYQGTPIESATTQSGVIAVAKDGDLSVFAFPAHALTQIDPRNDLPQALRARPGITLAYRFFAQPLDLDLRVDPSPPRARVEARTTVSIDQKLARVESRFDYHVSGGQAFELQFGVPEGLEWESAGPDAVVTSSRLLPTAATETASDSNARVLMLNLSAKAREAGTFSIVLAGRQNIDPAREVSVGMFQPRQATCRGTQVAVVGARNLEIELARPSSLAQASAAPPADWPWPEYHGLTSTAPALWLRDDDTPVSVPLKIAVLPRILRHESVVVARFDRRAIDARQEIQCRIGHDTLTHVDIAIPNQIERRWELDGSEVASRVRISEGPGGEIRYRLKLTREATESVRLRFRYRLPFSRPLTPERPISVELPVIRMLDGVGTAARIELIGEPGIQLNPRGAGWEFASLDDLGLARESGPSPGLIRPGGAGGDGPVRIAVNASALAALPELVVSRSWLKTVQGLDGELRTLAWYRLESHGASFTFALPAGARLEQAWVGSEAVREPSVDVDRNVFALALPAGAEASDLLVGVEYTVPPGRSRSFWQPPALQRGARVRQACWSIRVPWGRAQIGTPAGWSDENEWYWDYYFWKRRPTRDNAALGTWIGAPSIPSPLVDELVADSRSSASEYLFSRPGNTVPLRVFLVSRATLVGVCSGAVLAVGLVLLRLRIAANVLVALGSVLVLVMIALLDAFVLIQLLQSSLAGVVLVALAAATERVVDRRSRAGRPFADTSATPTPTPGTRTPVPDLGSDESTVIRSRAASTAEHLPLDRPLAGAPPILDPAPEPSHSASRY